VNGETVVEFLSYEGTLTAVGGPADGRTATDIGVAETTSTPVGQSLQRAADGTWFGPAAASFGACNGGGGEPPPPPGSTISFSGRDGGDPPLPVGFEDQLFATLRSGGATVPTTFTWTSETPAIASVDEDGVVRALAAGVAVIRATAADGTTDTYAVPTRAGAEGPAEYAGNTEFGIPTDADASDDYILVREEFTTSYNRLRNIPNWVSYNLDANDFGGEDRCDCFTFDPELPASFARYTTADYTGAGAAAGFGVDRGHLAPSADRTSGSLDNARTFYFSNIIPQAADNNQGPWASFENHLRDLVRGEGRELYVVTGAYGSQGTVKDEGVITIPTRTWKVVLVLPAGAGLDDVDDPSDVLDVIAIDLPNAPGIRSDPWQSFRTTVDAVEAASGYDLLARLPDGTERVLEAQRNVRNYELDLRPSPLSLASTPVVNAVLLSRPDFDATLVDAANVRLVVNGGAEVQPNRRGTMVNTSVADFDGDGRADRLIAFRMSDLRAAGFSATASDLVLRPAGGSPAWEARDPAPPAVIP
jgi:endonuclease G